MDNKNINGNLIKKIKIKDVTELDLNKSFFHYTNILNLDDIIKKGLEPRIGENAKGLEKSKKVFFTVGDKATLIIMDVWLKWLRARPKNKYIYRLGAYFLKKSCFPKFIYDIIFNKWHNSEKKLYKAFKDLKKILDSSIFLILDLEENVDFDYNDIDEVKAQNYPRRFLKGIYSYGGDVNDIKMEHWNMHTYSNKIIEKSKISLLKINNNYSANEIIKYFANKNKKYMQEHCKMLCEYLEYIEKGK